MKISRFDAGNYLETPEAIATYLTEALATNDTAYIRAAHDAIARAKEMASKSAEGKAE